MTMNRSNEIVNERMNEKMNEFMNAKWLSDYQSLICSYIYVYSYHIGAINLNRD